MIYWARVSELRDEVGAEDFDEVVELFLEEVDEAIIALRDFANLCQAVEAAAAAGQGGDVDIAAIVQSYTDARAVFINQSADRLVA